MTKMTGQGILQLSEQWQKQSTPHIQKSLLLYLKDGKVMQEMHNGSNKEICWHMN